MKHVQTHDPVKLFHPPMTAKEFSGWYEVIFPTQETKQKQGAAINFLDQGGHGASPKPRETVMLDLVLKSDEMTSAELDRVAGGTVDASELGMIRIQSLASQRQTALQTATDILHSSSDTIKGIINHIH